MKNIIIIALFLFTNSLFAKNVTTTFKIDGNCQLCKDRIEKSLDISGVTFAEWDPETKLITVRFNDNKITLEEIHAAVGNVGHATEKVSANPDKQAKLPACCQPKKPVKACSSSTQKGCCAKTPQKACDTKEKQACSTEKKKSCCSK